MIYECPRCHQKNRLPDNVQPGPETRCGRCGTSLTNPDNATRPAFQNIFLLPKTRRAIAERLRPQNKAQQIVVLLTVVYFALLLALLAMNAAGPDQWWFGTVNLYLPQWIWAIPAVILIPVTVVIARHWTFAPALCLLIVFGPLMGLCVPLGRPVSSAGRTRLRVMTYNVKWGEHDPYAVGRDIEKYQPDILQLQDSGGVMDGPLRTVLTGWNVRTNGQYLVASRLPIVSFQALPLSHVSTENLCIRSTVQVGPSIVTVYNVHLESPRYGLYAVGSGQVGGIVANAAERLQEARLVSAYASHEPGPTLLTGDLNAPMPSLVCRDLEDAGLHDAFTEAGTGYGYTYGQYTKLKHPYVRIDHIFLSRHWQAQSVSVGNDTGSEHCPVIADIILQGKRLKGTAKARPVF